MTGIQWLSWSKEAFEKAKTEGKPIILDIYGSWCHWCSVMDSRTYADADVAKLMSEKFIPVRVDADKRPDISERYNQGGWPSTVFLTANGRVITGATYVPPREMLQLMHQVAEYHEINEGVVGDDRIKVEHPAPKTHSGISGKISEEIVEGMAADFDSNHGGFGYEPKFPFPDATSLLFLRFVKTRDEKFLKMALATLDGIAGSGKSGSVTGLLDSAEGGFFRYSVSQDWSIPHYEKMLETNSNLLINYLDAYAITKSALYRDVCEKTVDYMKNNLEHPEGGFYGSQAADEEYYAKNPEERKKSEKPPVDKTIYIDKSAIAVSAFEKAYGVLGIEHCRGFAIKTADILVKLRDGGMPHYYDTKENKPFLFGLLSDNIYAVRALLDVYEMTADVKYLDEAEKLAKFVLKNFRDGDSFVDRIPFSDDIGYLTKKRKPLDENAACANAFLRLGVFLSNSDYKKIAEKALESFVREAKGIYASGYALAVEKFMDPIEIVAVGADHAPLLAIPDARIIVQRLEINSPLAKKKGYKEPGVYVCHRHDCQRFATAEEAEKRFEGDI